MENTENSFTPVKLSTILKPCSIYRGRYIGSHFETFLNTCKKVAHGNNSEGTPLTYTDRPTHWSSMGTPTAGSSAGISPPGTSMDKHNTTAQKPLKHI